MSTSTATTPAAEKDTTRRLVIAFALIAAIVLVVALGIMKTATASPAPAPEAPKANVAVSQAVPQKIVSTEGAHVDGKDAVAEKPAADEAGDSHADHVVADDEPTADADVHPEDCPDNPANKDAPAADAPAAA